MDEKEIRKIINGKINYNGKLDYDGFDMSGFDMSGFGQANYKNMEILSRFKDIIYPKNDDDEFRNPFFIIPIFWKGCGQLVKVSMDNSEKIEEITAATTEDIIFRIIELQNPYIFKR